MEVFAMFLMILQVVSLFAAVGLVALITGIGGYSLTVWWIARREAIRKVSLARL